MRTRVLDKSEWADLPAEGLTALLARTPDAEVYVVEDGERIVGCLAALRVTHLEGLWIAPEYRGNAGLGRRLVRQARAVLDACGWAFSSVKADAMHDVMRRLGGVKTEGETYVLTRR